MCLEYEVWFAFFEQCEFQSSAHWDSWGDSPKSCSVGMVGLRGAEVGEGDWERPLLPPACTHTCDTVEGGRLLWLFVTCFDTLLLVVTKRNFLVTKLIVFDGVIRNNYLNNTVRKEGNPFYFLFAEHKRDPGHAGWGVPETWHSHRWDLLGEAQPSLRHPPALWEQDEQEL